MADGLKLPRIGCCWSPTHGRADARAGKSEDRNDTYQSMPHPELYGDGWSTATSGSPDAVVGSHGSHVDRGASSASAQAVENALVSSARPLPRRNSVAMNCAGARAVAAAGGSDRHGMGTRRRTRKLPSKGHCRDGLHRPALAAQTLQQGREAAADDGPGAAGLHERGREIHHGYRGCGGRHADAGALDADRGRARRQVGHGGRSRGRHLGGEEPRPHDRQGAGTHRPAGEADCRGAAPSRPAGRRDCGRTQVGSGRRAGGASAGPRPAGHEAGHRRRAEAGRGAAPDGECAPGAHGGPPIHAMA